MSNKSALRPRYLKIHAAFVFAFLFAPIVVLVVFSFNHAKSGTDFTGFSTHWYNDLLHNSDVLKAFRNTLKVAIAATFVATIIGTLAAFALTRFRFAGRAGYSTLVFVSLVVPEVVMGISLLVFYVNVAHMRLGLTTVILSHITFCIAFVVVVVKARLAAFDNSLVEAAADLGATPVQTFLRVVLPLASPGIAAGAMLAFTISLDDVVITFFTSGPGSTTLPLYIFGQLKFGVSPSINALSSFVLLFSLVLLGIGGVFSARAAKRGVGGIDPTGVRIPAPGTIGAGPVSAGTGS
ncbi:MAG TPA: ABC transporter permease [Acidimicrobiia bacterium]|nr:ABC transporter permease [Acidimicrobiia bacterium]